VPQIRKKKIDSSYEKEEKKERERHTQPNNRGKEKEKGRGVEETLIDMWLSIQ